MRPLQLKEMGDATKRRLAVFAQQFNERMQSQGQRAGTTGGAGGGIVGSTGAAAERRGLLDGDGDGDEDELLLELNNNSGGKKNN